MKPVSVIVYKFRMSDVEDPHLYAAGPIYDWQESESGKWVMERSISSPAHHLTPDKNFFGYEVTVSALLSPEDYTYWNLKWA